MQRPSCKTPQPVQTPCAEHERHLTSPPPTGRLTNTQPHRGVIVASHALPRRGYLNPTPRPISAGVVRAANPSQPTARSPVVATDSLEGIYSLHRIAWQRIARAERKLNKLPSSCCCCCCCAGWRHPYGYQCVPRPSAARDFGRRTRGQGEADGGATRGKAVRPRIRCDAGAAGATRRQVAQCRRGRALACSVREEHARLPSTMGKGGRAQWEGASTQVHTTPTDGVL